MENRKDKKSNKLLTELDWKTLLNASRKRKKQADKIREKFPNMYDTELDRLSDELEAHANKAFKRQHGKGGNDFQYEGDEPTDFRGRYKVKNGSDSDFKKKAPEIPTKYGSIKKYRYGTGDVWRNGGLIYDDTFDIETIDGDEISNERHYSKRVNKNGSQYEPNLSTVGNEVSMSKDADYNAALDSMEKDMLDYYTGKSFYRNGNGWMTSESKIRNIIRESINNVLLEENS